MRGRMNQIESLELRRLLAAGQVDPSFGVLGTTRISVSPANQVVNVSLLDGDVLAVFNTDVKGRAKIVHLNRDGSIDAGFGKGKPVGSSGTVAIEQDEPTRRIALLRRVLGTNSYYIAMLNSDGTTNKDFNG